MRYTAEVVFPSCPMEATFIYYALLAYPEAGAGEVGKKGSSFANALVHYLLWSTSKSRGLNWVRTAREDATFTAPRKRAFEGALHRGLRRIHQRLVAYDLLGQRLLEGFFRAAHLGNAAIRDGRADEVYHINPKGGPSPMRQDVVEKALPSEGELLSRSPSGWHQKLRLNETYRYDSEDQQVKDLKRRALQPSHRVLHMAHAFEQCCSEYSNEIDGWDEREPLEAMLMNGPRWIWRAIQIAEEWRSAPFSPITGKPRPEEMVRLIRAEKAL